MASPMEVELKLTEDDKKELISQIEPSIQKILNRVNDPNWKPYKKKKGYEIFWMKTDESPIITIKSEGIVDASVSQMMHFLEDFVAASKIIDAMHIEGRVLAQLGNNYQVTYGSYKMPPLITSRDFFMVALDATTADGVGVSIAQSIERPEVPDRPGYVRAHLNPTGYVFKALPDNPSKVFLQYVVNADVKGWIPHWVVNASAASQGDNIRRIQEHFAPDKKKEKEDEDIEDNTDKIPEAEKPEETAETEKKAGKGKKKKSKGKKNKKGGK
eukprot:Phypoly_transcript_14985.p1 GENE.Phypoly_transcript_14985~~Phypoly_transcript_14985.p1  ORF type:complete len:271 (+),score=57.97 Phypoly_transcript_14985:111-923(+)